MLEKVRAVKFALAMESSPPTHKKCLACAVWEHFAILLPGGALHCIHHERSPRVVQAMWEQFSSPHQHNTCTTVKWELLIWIKPPQ